MSLSKVATHSLCLSEIRTHIAGFLAKKDCLSCMCVSRMWLMDFAGPIWHTINFDKDKSFLEISPEVVFKYGHLIRDVVKLFKEDHVMALQNPNIASIKKLQFFVTENKLSLILFFDLIRYYRQSLTTLCISGELVRTATLDEQLKTGIYLSLDTIAPGSGLTKLTLAGVCMTHRAFSSVLRYCLSLESLTLLNVIFLTYNPMMERFRHTGLKSLVAPRQQVWSNGEGLLPGALSLLIHFPALETWIIFDSPVESLEVLKKLKAELVTNCPRLKRVQFSSTEQNRITSYLDNGFYGLESVTFGYVTFNQAVLLGLLEHQATLTSIILTPSAAKIEPSTPDEIVTSKKMIGLILKSCQHLCVLSVEGHQMDVSFFEDERIACMNLQELRVRFCGLGTTVLVDECLETLARRKISAESVGVHDRGGVSVGDRVCCQLMRFKKLKIVWLGTKDYYLPTQ
ncbi:hypothetical protein BGZ47_011014 [Haplosporangium gracile]|nr:hypothetical protein BGZ47_011014 [Haplosporangium gracile]